MEKEDTIESIVDELPVLLVRQAYKKLKSGDDLTASEMKVCLDVCKTYGTGVTTSSDVDLLSELPFEDEERQK